MQELCRCYAAQENAASVTHIQYILTQCLIDIERKQILSHLYTPTHTHTLELPLSTSPFCTVFFLLSAA